MHGRNYALQPSLKILDFFSKFLRTWVQATQSAEETYPSTNKSENNALMTI